MPDCVEYCLTNVTPAARTRLREREQHTVERRCLQRCGRCRRSAFLIVDGERVTGTGHDELLDRVLAGEADR
jgi:uncharacterized protein YuzB (UPF0349 family)